MRNEMGKSYNSEYEETTTGKSTNMNFSDQKIPDS